MIPSDLYRGFRYPAEIISHVVWLYFRFCLSFRDIEELMASRGIFVTYETIRQWTLKFGHARRRASAAQGIEYRAEISPQPTRQRERQTRQGSVI